MIQNLEKTEQTSKIDIDNEVQYQWISLHSTPKKLNTQTHFWPASTQHKNSRNLKLLTQSLLSSNRESYLKSPSRPSRLAIPITNIEKPSYPKTPQQIIKPKIVQNVRSLNKKNLRININTPSYTNKAQILPNRRRFTAENMGQNGKSDIKQFQMVISQPESKEMNRIKVLQKLGPIQGKKGTTTTMSGFNLNKQGRLLQSKVNEIGDKEGSIKKGNAYRIPYQKLSDILYA